MNISVLDIATLGSGLTFDSIKSLGNIQYYDITMPEDVNERISNADIVVANKVKLREENLVHAKNLKLICVTATGYDNIDIDYCRTRNIAVCNVAGYSTDSVAQLTISMVFSLATNLGIFDRYVKSGEYTDSGIFNRVEPVFHEISGMTWGIVGLGNIGTKVARVAKAMGCNILAYKRTPVDEFCCTDIDTLCRQSDIITIHVPLTPETYHLINEKRLSMMKKDAILINVARGDVMDEAAVCQAVLNNKIGALGVDVYSAEPMQKDSPYQKLLNKENVIFTPHMAWGAIDARQRCIDEVAKNIESFIDGDNRSRIV